MARIAFVAREIDRAVDVNRQIGVDLDQAPKVALIPVVAAPRLAGHVLDGEPLVRRQIDMAHRALTAAPDRFLEDAIDARFGNDERLLVPVVTFDQRAVARQFGLELLQAPLRTPTPASPAPPRRRVPATLRRTSSSCPAASPRAIAAPRAAASDIAAAAPTAPLRSPAWAPEPWRRRPESRQCRGFPFPASPPARRSPPAAAWWPRLPYATRRDRRTHRRSRRRAGRPRAPA